jgi:large subunit ribosomal protein L4
MKIDVIKLDGGKSSASIDLPDDIFGIAEIRADILQRCVTWQLAKRRAGTHKIQVRNEVSRTGKKMYRQKGTGGARHGSRRAAQFVGGAKAHGPVVRSHAFDLPKKVRALALRHALSSKALAGSLVVLESAELKSPKTAALRASFAKIGLTNALLIAGPEVDGALRLAARNIPNVDVLPNAGLNVYDVLRRDTLVLTRAAVDGVVARFAKNGAAPAEAPKRPAKAAPAAEPAPAVAEAEPAAKLVAEAPPTAEAAAKPKAKSAAKSTPAAKATAAAKPKPAAKAKPAKGEGA